MSIRLVLADDHPIVLHGLQRLFERHGDIQVVASCADGGSAVEAVRTIKTPLGAQASWWSGWVCQSNTEPRGISKVQTKNA